VRLPHLVEWLGRHSPDVVCLQETKCEDAAFPGAEIEQAGYRWVHHGQKTYNGVALLARAACENVGRGIPDIRRRAVRVIGADFGDTRVVSVLRAQRTERGSDKYEYKLRWLEALRGWLASELARHPAHRRARRLQHRARGARRARPRASGKAACCSARPSARRSARCSTSASPTPSASSSSRRTRTRGGTTA
jgi:hypothetical protein